MLPTAAAPLCPEYPSVKDALTAISEQEIHYLHRKMKTEAPPPRTGTERKDKAPIVTALTVSQLGVLIRALTDANIIQYDNQTELLRMIASCVTTTKLNPISPEGLRVRYYNPDKASVSITKEYLTQMLSQLKKY